MKAKSKPKVHSPLHPVWEIKSKSKRVKCIYCKQPIHLDHWAGMTKKGYICDNSFCLMELAKELDNKSKSMRTLISKSLKEVVRDKEQENDASQSPCSFNSRPKCPRCKSKNVNVGMEQGIVEFDCEDCQYYWKEGDKPCSFNNQKEILIREFNKFIEKWCKESYPHLIDNDENDGQRFRDLINEFKKNEKIILI